MAVSPIMHTFGTSFKRVGERVLRVLYMRKGCKRSNGWKYK